MTVGKQITENTRNKVQLKFSYHKSLLRVRGIKELEAEIEEKKRALSQLVTEARDFYGKCMKYRFVMRIMYQQSPIVYKGRIKLNTETLHIPIMNFIEIYYDNASMTTGKKRKKQVVFAWEAVSKALDEANASLDERLIHMRVYHAFKDFYSRSRGIAQELSCLYHSKNHFEQMIEYEKMGRKDLPAFMLEKAK
ncbi:hypothetical protein ACFPVS_02565 [Neisseria weixii]|uniref:hypothetical protein n=1 Tax=Neisseria weixii TaxID=1853276 RepID=UPI000BB96C8A|nr:hypothetical protein [Neisseria weixii]ATD64984.1 hypothetical protein CGZ65_05940 [Neisseria weixii]